MPKIRVPRHEVIQPLDQPFRYIPLTQGQNAIVDAADYDWLNQWNWFAVWAPNTKSFYAKRQPNIPMQRVIMGGLADHKSHDTLDNRRQNLRPCTTEQNNLNTRGYGRASNFKGVSWDKETRKWHARIRTKGRCISLGRFVSPEDAAKAYDEAAQKYHGEFGHLNLPITATAQLQPNTSM
jgi:hypothetical protein